MGSRKSKKFIVVIKFSKFYESGIHQIADVHEVHIDKQEIRGQDLSNQAQESELGLPRIKVTRPLSVIGNLKL